MADSGWAIRFYEGNVFEKEGNIDFTSNFKKIGSRQLDTVIAFSGMYGIDNYLIWNIHKDLPSYDFSTVVLNLRLTMYKNVDMVYFQDFYRVQDIKFSPNKSQYTLYAISETTVRLHTKLISYGVKSLSYKEDRTGKNILDDVLTENNIFYVIFHNDSISTKEMIHYQYRYFNIDPEWTVLDLIEYIADDNKYEWCVTTTVDEDNKPYFWLHIGHELYASEFMNATKPFSRENDSMSHSNYAMKITTNSSPMEPLAHWEESMKCIWSKHTVGRTGGISKGCFIPIGMGHFDKFLYMRTLEGQIEKNIGYSMLNRRKKKTPSINIGNILIDDGNPQFIDSVSIQKNPHSYSIREPHNILIDRGDELAVQHQKERITRSTPYLDHNAGLLFPSPALNEGESPPNSILFNVGGKIESTVVGPFVMGNGRDNLELPLKENKKDLRLQLLNGWCLYIKENGDTYVQREGADPKAVPDISNTQIYLGPNGSIKFNGGGHFISHDTHKHGYKHLHTTGNMGIPIPPLTAADHIGVGQDVDATTDNTTKTEVE